MPTPWGGGNIGLHFALAYPALVAGVAICDTGAGSDDPAQFRAITEGWARAAEAGGTAGFTAAILQHPIFSLEARLRALQVPALIVMEERDLPCIAPSEFMARTIPEAEQHVMTGCGHFNNLERPAEFNRVVETFFQRIGWEG